MAAKRLYIRLSYWLRAHDPGLRALRRAGRAAIVMPAMFALGDRVIGNPALASTSMEQARLAMAGQYGRR